MSSELCPSFFFGGAAGRPGQLTIHADRGAPMTARSTPMLYADLGIFQSHKGEML